MCRLSVVMILLLLNHTILAQEYSSQVSTKSQSNYAIRLGVIQTAPGLFVENTDKNSSGHIQQEIDYGYSIGLFSMPERKEWWDFFINFDYYSFSMNRQLIGNEKSVDLDTEASGRTLEIVPGFALILPFFDSSLLSFGIGYGIRLIEMAGDIYITDGNISSECQSAIENIESGTIKRSCERFRFDEQLITYSLINTISLKLSDFLFRYNFSSATGSAQESQAKHVKDEHEYRVVLTSFSISYLYFF